MSDFATRFLSIPADVYVWLKREQAANIIAGDY